MDGSPGRSFDMHLLSSLSGLYKKAGAPLGLVTPSTGLLDHLQMRKTRIPLPAEPDEAHSLETGPLSHTGFPCPSKAAAANRAAEPSMGRSASAAVSLEVPGLVELKGALVLEGLLAPEKAFPPRQGVNPLPCVDDLELGDDLPVVTSVDAPVRYAGGRYALPPVTEVEPGTWATEVRFGANGRWIRRLGVRGPTAEEAQTVARRVLETAVKNRVSLETAHAAVIGHPPSA